MIYKSALVRPFTALAASSLLFLGCYEVGDASGVASGGASAFAAAGNASAGDSSSGAGTSSGGTSEREASGGSANSSANNDSGGSPGAAATEGGRASGEQPQGGSNGDDEPSSGDETSGGDANGDEPPSAAGRGSDETSGGAGGSAGSTSATAGGMAAGGMAAGGMASGGMAGMGGGDQDEVLCVDANGDPVPYDFVFGMAAEYAFELSMSCDVGGYVAPLLAADPVELTQVNAFILELTDWYRSEVLLCDGDSSNLAADDFGLLPVSQAKDASKSDLEASTALFMMVIDRHDEQPDAVAPALKQKIHERLKLKADKAVKNAKNELTKPLAPPDCVPADGASG